jgi:hypothetical protein
MTNPLQFYTNTKAELEKEATVLKTKSARLSTFRFAVFLGISSLIYSFLGFIFCVFDIETKHS